MKGIDDWMNEESEEIDGIFAFLQASYYDDFF